MEQAHATTTDATGERARRLLAQFAAEQRQVWEGVQDNAPTAEQARLLAVLSAQVVTCRMVLGEE